MSRSPQVVACSGLLPHHNPTVSHHPSSCFYFKPSKKEILHLVAEKQSAGVKGRQGQEPAIRMKWGGKKQEQQRQPQQQQVQQQQQRSTAASGFPFSQAFMGRSWISKLKQGLISKARIRPTKREQEEAHSSNSGLKPKSKSLSSASSVLGGFGPSQVFPTSHSSRISSLSDHLSSSSPPILDQVSRDRAPAGELLNRSCRYTDGEFPCVHRSETGGGRSRRTLSFGYSRSAAGTDVDFFSSKSCRSDLTSCHHSNNDSVADTGSSSWNKRVEERHHSTSSKSSRSQAFNVPAAELKPIKTTTRTSASPDPKVVVQQGRRSFSSKTRRSSRSRVKVYSPRVAAAAASATKVDKSRAMATARRSLESFAVVKRSTDPRRDFMESMLEMISEWGIRGAEELEGLLACYISLNSDEYHDVIVEVFRRIWLELGPQESVGASARRDEVVVNRKLQNLTKK